jgi:Holliday junction DNA helicase RuvA
LRIYTHVREDAIQLYGFPNLARARALFEINFRSGHRRKIRNLDAFGNERRRNRHGYQNGQSARLTSIPGVGKKTAERMVIELRDKLNEFTAQSTQERIAAGGKQAELPADAVFDDALSALINLGYQRNAAEKALNQTVKDGTEVSVQKLLRKSLQLLAKG